LQPLLQRLLPNFYNKGVDSDTENLKWRLTEIQCR